MRKRFWKGLRTLDVVILASIICMVLGVIIFRYPHFKCRAMQSEAKFSLQEIYSAQKLFHAEHEYYAPISRLLGEERKAVLMQKYYTFSDLIVPTKDAFSVVAKGVTGTLVAGEEWLVNHTNEVRLVKAMCREP